MIDWSLYLRYEKGKLFWKERDDFPSEKERRRWNNRYAGDEAGINFRPSGSKTTYRRLRLNGKHYMAHAIVCAMFDVDVPRGTIIDHDDGDGLNNDIANLKIVTPSQSAKNKPLHKNNNSGKPGVNFDSKNKKWVARVVIDGRRTFLGNFATLDEAIAARSSAETTAAYHPNHGRHAAL